MTANQPTDLLPCQSVHYLHCLRGGPEDGTEIPSANWYETVAVNGSIYGRDGSPEPMPKTTWTALNCTEDYSEPVWMKAPMQFLGSQS